MEQTANSKKIKGVKTKEAFSVTVASKLTEIYPPLAWTTPSLLDNPALEDGSNLTSIMSDLLDKRFTSFIHYRGEKDATSIGLEANAEKLAKSMKCFNKCLQTANAANAKIVPIEFHRYIDFKNVKFYNTAYDSARESIFPARMIIDMGSNVSFTKSGQTLVINTGFIAKIQNIVPTHKWDNEKKKVLVDTQHLKKNNAAEHLLMGNVKVNTVSASDADAILAYPLFVDPTDTGLLMINLLCLKAQQEQPLVIKSINVTFYALCVNDIPSDNKVMLDIIKKKDMRFGRHLKNTKITINVNDFSKDSMELPMLASTNETQEKVKVKFCNDTLASVQKREIYNPEYVAVPGIINCSLPILLANETLLTKAYDKLDFHNIAFLKGLSRYVTYDSNWTVNVKRGLSRNSNLKVFNGSCYNMPDYKDLSSNVRRINEAIELLHVAVDESEQMIEDKFSEEDADSKINIRTQMLKFFDFYRSYKILEDLSKEDILEKIGMSDQNMYDGRLDHKPPLSVSILRSLRYLKRVTQLPVAEKRAAAEAGEAEDVVKKIKSDDV